MGKTRIEWCTTSWSPIIGCSPVSEGCEHCFARRFARRLAGGYTTHRDDYRVIKEWDGSVRFLDGRLDEPLHWRKPKVIFVCSMGDLFHDSVPDEWITKVLATIVRCPQHRFIILTKRAERMRDYFQDAGKFDNKGHEIENIILKQTGEYQPVEFPLPNLTLMVTAENQRRLDERVPILLETPAAIRGVSLEPLLSPVNLWGLQHLDWLIVGAETGTGRRFCRLDWIESIVRWCHRASVPVFVKKIAVGGKIIKDFEQFPESVRVREYQKKIVNSE